MKPTIILGGFVLLTLTGQSAAMTAADLPCSYGGVTYHNVDLIPHPNNCTELQCQFGVVVPYYEACGRDIDGECHTLGSSFKHNDIVFECQMTVVDSKPIYKNVRITPIYKDCDYEGKTYKNLEKFSKSDPNDCSVYQCQDAKIIPVEPACGKELDGTCHTMALWFAVGDKTYVCERQEKNGEIVIEPVTVDVKNQWGCTVGTKKLAHLEYFTTGDGTGCNQRQCQSGSVPTPVEMCKFYKDQGKCYYQGEQWIWDEKLWQCNKVTQDDGKTIVTAQTNDTEHLKCWLGENLYEHMDVIVTTDCNIRQCLDGDMPFLKKACSVNGECHAVNSTWQNGDKLYKCIFTSYGYIKVVEIDENGGYDEGEGPQLPEFGQYPEFKGCDALADIIYVIDASRSMSPDNFKMELDFSSNITKSFFSGTNNQIRFGAVVFSDDAKKQFDLKDHTTSDSLVAALQATPFLRQKTSTFKALNLIADQQMFSTANGGRDDAPNIVIIMTDGQSDNTNLTLAAAERVKAMDVTIIVVGVGFLNLEELYGMASSYENAYLVPSFDMLAELQNGISQRACDSVDKCKDSPCEHFCFGTDTGFTCTCKKGYQVDPADKTKCIDVNECLNTTHPPCEQKCENRIPSYICKCMDGYIIDQQDRTKCIDIDECELGLAQCEQECTNLPGSFECSCKEGYVVSPTDPKKCIDIDECKASGGSPCEQTCTNVPGSFECSCEEGYKVDPNDATKCEEIDFCRKDPCEQICTNIPGGFNCSCKGGYIVSPTDPTKCEDIDECKADGGSPCEQKCTNLPGSFECSCNEGFEVSHADPTKCKDIDECKSELPPCQQLCLNMPGSFRCTCEEGYEVHPSDESQCIDIDECEIEIYDDCTGGTKPRCQYKCKNLPGTYECSCKDGFKVDLSDPSKCIDVDECDNSPCAHNCGNLHGSFKCFCNEGYVVDPADTTKCNQIIKCRSKADFIFMFDSSSSIGKEHYPKQFEFAKRVARHFDLGPNDVRIAGLLFSRLTETLFHLKDIDNYAALDKMLTGIPYMDGSTYTHSALRWIDLTDMFGPAQGGRKDAKDVVILITDGNANRQSQTVKYAQVLKDKGVDIMAIAIGEDIALDKLEEVVSKPEYIFQALSYDMLEYIEQGLTSKACRASEVLRRRRHFLDFW